MTVYENSDQCTRERLFLCSQQSQIEINDFDEAYFQTSLPLWTFVLENKNNERDNGRGTVRVSAMPIHASKVGGAPAVYPIKCYVNEHSSNEYSSRGRGRGKGGGGLPGICDKNGLINRVCIGHDFQFLFQVKTYLLHL